MTKFQEAIKFTLQWEGGYVNNENDPGGETNLGITWPTLLRAIKDGLVPADTTIQSLTVPLAMIIYERYYWADYQLDTVVSPLCIVLFDMYVNHSPSSVRRLREASGDDWMKLIQKRKDFYGQLVAKNPKMKVFLKGWLNRANDLTKYCAIVAQEQ